MPMPVEAVKRKFLPDGRVAYIVPNLFNVYITRATEWADDLGLYDEMWTYTSVSAALAALDEWDGLGEPEGWIRHQPSNRRREYGDPAREEIRP